MRFTVWVMNIPNLKQLLRLSARRGEGKIHRGKTRSSNERTGDRGCTGIIGPNGQFIAGPLKDDREGIVYADLDMEKILAGKVLIDVLGHYSRFDILSLNFTKGEYTPIRRPKAVKEDKLTRNLLEVVKDLASRSEELAKTLKELKAEFSKTKKGK